MLPIKIKNTVRALVGHLSIYFSDRKHRKSRLYCNLIGGKVSGGPDRFLRNLLASSSVENEIEISNWSLKKCNSALVFSSSWGDSFTKFCRKNLIRSVLRVMVFMCLTTMLMITINIVLNLERG